MSTEKAASRDGQRMVGGERKDREGKAKRKAPDTTEYNLKRLEAVIRRVVYLFLH